jgi:hypothetical protein
MLSNYVAQADLLKYFPKLASYLPSTQNDFTTQITEAFNIVLDDIRARELEPRRLMIPLDLKRTITSTDDQDTLTSSTQTSSTTGTYIWGRTGFCRFVANVSAITAGGGTFSIQLQGSNDIAANQSTAPDNWTNVGSALTPTTTGNTSTVIQAEYKFYRYVNIQTGTSITYTLALYENYVERWIIYKALEMICRDQSREVNDIWWERMRTFANLYESAFKNYKFTIDDNDDNLVGDEDSTDNTAQVRFTR